MGKVKVKIDPKGVRDLERRIAEQLKGAEVEVPCPKCGEATKGTVGGTATCPGCGLSFEIRT